MKEFSAKGKKERGKEGERDVARPLALLYTCFQYIRALD